jgi:hypothetical protein
MRASRNTLWSWLAAVVVGHFMLCLVHGAAHTGAHVPLSLVANIFVGAVILVGPLAGLALARRAAPAGYGLVAVTMAGALVFGIVNHFVLAGPDHVSRVEPPWRPLFAWTAALLAATEALGSGLAVRLLRKGIGS